MLVPGVITPREYSAHRAMFEGAYQNGDECQMRRASLGGQFELVRRRLSNIAFAGGPLAAERAYGRRFRDPLSEYVGIQVAALQSDMGPGSSRRQNPQLYAALVDQMALLPMLFSFGDETARSLRREYIARHGMYGLVGDVLRAQLQTRPVGEEGHRRRVGSINETTPFALFNRAQSPNRVALPSLPVADEQDQVDIIFLTRTNDGVRHTEGQVKSDEQKFSAADPGSPLLIGGRALGNSYRSEYWQSTNPFQTARAVVDEIDGRASPYQTQVLDMLERDLTEAIVSRQPFAVPVLDLAA